MANAFDSRQCPFCGHQIVLGECSIVATNVPRGFSQDDDEDAKGNDEKRLPPSGAPALDYLNDLPVVAYGQLHQSGMHRRLKSVLVPPPLQPVTEVAAPVDLPARACTNCRWPLPVDIDDRRVLTIAVVGTKGAGKTHYLASAINDAARLQGLAKLGCTEFAPDEQTSRRYQDHYYSKLFDRHMVLEGTNADLDVVHQPLVFRVAFREYEPCVVMIHDVAGEVLQDPAKRAQAALFVRRADGVIFLVDPVQLKPLQDWLAASYPRPTWNQADLLLACIDDMDMRTRTKVPYAITLSKSDLVASARPDRYFQFRQDPPDQAYSWIDDLRTVEREVQHLLADLGAHDLLAAARQVEDASYHAVAPIGVVPLDGWVGDLRPLRCLDPLATVLLRIPGIAGVADQ